MITTSYRATTGFKNMESVFCFQIAVETLKLRKKVVCAIPCISVVFLNFPTILIQLDKVKHEKNNHYTFQKGKSCLFKISPTELFNRLNNSPIFLLVFDQKHLFVDADVNQQMCIGTTSFLLDKAMKIIIQGIQNCGLCKASSHGDSLALPVVDGLQNVVGFVNLVFKLTCLGNTILPHLPKSRPMDSFTNGQDNLTDYTFPKEHFSTIENLDFPPCLYYKAQASIKKIDSSDVQQSKNVYSNSDSLDNQENLLLKESRKNTVTNWQQKMQAFLAINPISGQKSEATQTDLEHLHQFPVLKALIDEVVTLGFSKPSTSFTRQDLILSEKHQTIQKPIANHLQASNIKVAKPLKPDPKVNYLAEQIPPGKKVIEKKKYPLSYGLTKTHLLRVSINKQPVLSQTYTKPFIPLKKKKKKLQAKRKITASKKFVSTFTQTLQVNLKKEDSSSDSSTETTDDDQHTDTESIELPMNCTKDVEDESLSPDKSSPRVLSRQSIEIRIPLALTEASQVSSEKQPIDDRCTPEAYKYSDDFDDRSLTHTYTGSVTTIDTSMQQAVGIYDSTEFADAGSPTRTIETMSPVPDLSQISALPKTTHDIIPEEPENYESTTSSITDSKKTNESKESLQSSVESQIKNHTKEPVSDLTTHDDDTKPTDESLASVVAVALLSPKLPKPAPSSDSPVIRSLVSEPGSRKPRPPAVSQSSSMERMPRKYKHSSETSFQFSDTSVRSSELADIKTSDISDMKSTEENISPIHSIDLFGKNSSVPTNRK